MGKAIGVAVGCIIGMFPLLFIDSHNTQEVKSRGQLKAMYVRGGVDEAGRMGRGGRGEEERGG